MAHLLSVSCSAGDVRLDASGWLHQHQGTRGAPICLGSVCKVTPLSHVNDLRDVFFFSHNALLSTIISFSCNSLIRDFTQFIGVGTKI